MFKNDTVVLHLAFALMTSIHYTVVIESVPFENYIQLDIHEI